MIFSCAELRLLRLSRQMKQEFIAKKMGITKQRYSELESNPNLKEERLDQILEVLGYDRQLARKYLDSIPNPLQKI